MVTTNDIWTSAYHGQSCTPNNTTQPCDSSLQCNSSESKCLCSSSQYWSNGCYALDDIKVKNVTYTVTTNAINLTWTFNGPGPTVTFQIRYGSVSINASSAGGSISGLIPGTKNNFIIASIPPSNEHFKYNEAIVTTGDIWTNPSQPGSIDKVVQLPNISISAYSIHFNEPSGNVSKYQLIIKNKTGSDIYNNESRTNTVIISGLTPGQSYNYTLYAINEIGKPSESRIGSFSTSATESGPISNDNLFDLKPTNVTLTWQTPGNPNGKINGYIVEVFSNNTCVFAHKINCSDCVSVIFVLNLNNKYFFCVFFLNSHVITESALIQ
uniref:Fibronectin type-III domain-containing protein n=1 Tax=Biomphalaria glabrata TaxID=6526 RepID=A0A2C9M043_BIOGL